MGAYNRTSKLFIEFIIIIDSIAVFTFYEKYCGKERVTLVMGEKFLKGIENEQMCCVGRLWITRG
jgi:hypothetical protein